jgi:hypothetical protein
VDGIDRCTLARDRLQHSSSWRLTLLPEMGAAVFSGPCVGRWGPRRAPVGGRLGQPWAQDICARRGSVAADWRVVDVIIILVLGVNDARSRGSVIASNCSRAPGQVLVNVTAAGGDDSLCSCRQGLVQVLVKRQQDGAEIGGFLLHASQAGNTVRSATVTLQGVNRFLPAFPGPQLALPVGGGRGVSS